MKIISVFNNKGGVGKSTLGYHLAHALAEQGVKTLMVDLDPQSNLSLQCLSPNALEQMWSEEEPYIQDFQGALEDKALSYEEFISSPRSIHCLLKPIEDGVFDKFKLGRIHQIDANLGIIPGRLSLHTFEDKIAKSWSEAFMGEPQAIRLITSIRNLCLEAAKEHGYQVAIIDTSPSLGILNKVVISTSTGFFVPCMPDMFSTFGITNIGMALRMWKTQFDTMYSLLTDKKRMAFPNEFVKFLGFTIYNAKRYAGQNDLDLAAAHYSYVNKLPSVIHNNIPAECYNHLTEEQIKSPIGGKAVMHSHNTLPSMAQKYRQPIWRVPELLNLEPVDKGTISGNRQMYTDKQAGYHAFARDLLTRLEGIDD
ncbi:ParA family protein [Vibrio vulnificus]|uniref:ParA family protein n=1 Tax=Vibrio vulnificus TaxID=672 RepID=UPI0005F1A95A|nr:AAA family ATPase [Vibrio vulnificus]HAS6028903.1 AAA family ATPase [Vibrio vulnificus]HAS6114405.1 AAA family ATPase [Vibrio vulnificus]HAS6123532.1 AAA family ATPase [Vibrio vulnificus]